MCPTYRNHLGAHSDTLSRLGPDAIVVGVSLGAKRVFMVQEKLPWGVKTPAGSGSEGTKKVIRRKEMVLPRVYLAGVRYCRASSRRLLSVSTFGSALSPSFSLIKSLILPSTT